MIVGCDLVTPNFSINLGINEGLSGNNLINDSLSLASKLGFGQLEPNFFFIVSEALKEAYSLFGENFGVSEAQQYGEGFAFEENVCDKDSELFFNCDCSISAMAGKIFEKSFSNRLNEDRVDHLRALDDDPDSDKDPDWARLRKLAAEGVKMTLPLNFIPMKEPRPLRNTYEAVAGAVNKTLY